MSTTTVDWADLPPEILHTIAANLHSLADYIRYRTVCRTWRAAAYTPPREFPWLMLPIATDLHKRAFFNPLTKLLHRLAATEASRNHRIAGSSHGWLVLMDESPSVFLTNPLTRAKIALPMLSSFPIVSKFDFYSIGREYTLRSPENGVYYCSLKEMRDSFVKKVIVSQSPYNGASFVAFAILNRHGEVAYCRNGDDSWRIVDQVRSYSEDVICFNGVFYAVDKFGSIAICDVTDVSGCETPKVSFINVEQLIGGDMQYLVDGMGELLLVSRYLEFDIDIEHYVEVCKTVRFCVYRLDVSEKRWERVSSLGDKVLFIGENSSFALLASDYAGCEGNRIYYTDDYSGGNYDGFAGDHDVGVYSLVDGTRVALPCYPRNCHRPIWITPTLC